MNNLISCNLIPQRFMLYFFNYEHFRTYHILKACFKFKPISVQHKGAEIQAKKYGT